MVSLSYNTLTHCGLVTVYDVDLRRSWLALVQVTACSLMMPSHYLNQSSSRPIIINFSEISVKYYIMMISILENILEIVVCKMASILFRPQWVKSLFVTVSKFQSCINCIFQYMGKLFCVEFQRYPLKFHTKYLTHTLKDMYFICRWKFKSS